MKPRLCPCDASSPRQHPFRLVGTPSRERGRAATFKLERTGYLQGLPSCCHLLWDSQPPQSMVSHMLRCLFPGLASCSQGNMSLKASSNHCASCTVAKAQWADFTFCQSTPRLQSRGSGGESRYHPMPATLLPRPFSQISKAGKHPRTHS